MCRSHLATAALGAKKPEANDFKDELLLSADSGHSRDLDWSA
jgi:hypothetical protein